jgi:hypothetical protein
VAERGCASLFENRSDVATRFALRAVTRLVSFEISGTPGARHERNGAQDQWETAPHMLKKTRSGRYDDPKSELGEPAPVAR